MKRGSLALVALALFVGTASCQRKQETPSAVTPGQIATLENVKSDVQRRKANELVWDRATEGLPLASQDAIKTGTASSGNIRFSASDTLRVEERSMVVVLERESKPDVDTSILALPHGQVKSEMSEANKKLAELVIRTPRGWLRASNRPASGKPEAKAVKFSVAVAPDGALDVKSDSGKVTYVTQGKEQVVEENHALSVAPAPEAMAVPMDLTAKEPPVVRDETIRVVKQQAEPTPTPSPSPSPSPIQSAPSPKKQGFSILTPSAKSETSAASIVVKGELRGSYSAYLNGEALKAGADGTFTVDVPLDPGANIITFQVVGPGPNQVNTVIREVTRK